MISDFCRKRVAPHLPPVHTEALRKFLIGSVDAGVGIPRYDQTTFYEAWRYIIQRHGIYNPYTDRGAIKGLLRTGHTASEMCWRRTF